MKDESPTRVMKEKQMDFDKFTEVSLPAFHILPGE